MGLRLQIKKSLEYRFREAAMGRFGYGRGALSKAAEEALERWLWVQENRKISFEGDPVEAIDGLLKDLDIDAVELQHVARQLWAKNVLRNVSS